MSERDQDRGAGDGRGEDWPERPTASESQLLFTQAMAQTRMAMCIADPHQPDAPLVFANAAFCEMTGYAEHEVVGRNCRFLQGPETDRAAVAQVRDALAREAVTVVELLNYRKDGSTLWNALHVGPIYDESGRLLYHFGSQWDVTNVRAARAAEQLQRLLTREVSHRMKNMFSVIAAMVKLTGKEDRDAANQVATIHDRIVALGRAHEATLEVAASERPTDLATVADAVLAAYETGDRPRLDYDGPQVDLDYGAVSTLGLILHELATNAVKHGALGAPDGRVSVEWRVEEVDAARDRLRLRWTETGGPAPRARAAGDAERGSGIVARLLGMSQGALRYDFRPTGLRAEVELSIRRPAA